MKMRTGLVAALAAAGALLLAACSGDTDVTVSQPQQTGITVNGRGSVTVVPDVAVLSIAIEVTRPAVADARDEAATTMEDVRGALDRDGIDERDMKTQFFSIRPQYSRPRDGQPEITGFTVSNQLSVKVRNIDDVSKVLDDAVAAGGDAVRVNNISFTVDEPEQYVADARKEAMADARQRAEQLADLAGVTLGDARSISESGGAIPVPLRGADFGFAVEAASAPAPTPISPGESEVSLTVFVVYGIE